MIVAHLSELHLGFRAYTRIDRGRNVRERDVASVFDRAVQELTSVGPDLIVITGDVFDRADPPPSALLTLTRGLDTLRSELPDTPVVLAAGARDTPIRPGDAVALSVLESLPGVEVASGAVHALRLGAPDVHVCLVPYRAGLREPYPVPAPDPRARWNVVAAYGTVGPGGAGVPVDPSEWSYVACGGHHVHRVVEGNVVYPGSLERVGRSPWEEAAEEKGFVTVDLESGRMRFHALSIRPVVSLAPVRTPPTGPADLPGRVIEVTREVPGGIEDKIVRLRVQGARPRDLLVLQGDLLADLSRRALHLDVEVEPGEVRPGLPPGGRVLEAGLEGRPAARRAVDRLLSSVDAEPTLPTLRVRLAEEDSVLGTLDLRLQPGVTGVISAEASAVHRLLSLLAPRSDGLRPPWLGPDPPEGPGRVADAVETVLATLAGARPLELALERLGASGTGAALDPADAVEPEEIGRRLAELEGAEDELRRLERKLRGLRADHAEVAGDLEVATMEWLRERQDAETHLQAYRDRARELKAQLAQMEAAGADAPCPTCGRTLGEHHPPVLAELREEWESVVQDGSWWKRRREQLELKPESLQELEGRALRLQASVEELAERLEVARNRVRERDELRERAAELGSEVGGVSSQPGGGQRGKGDGMEEAEAVLRDGIQEIRGEVRNQLLERASRYLALTTGSRVLAMTGGEDGALRLEGVASAVAATDEETAAAEVCLRLAGAVIAAEETGGVEGALLPLSLVERLGEEDRLRLVDFLPTLRDRVRHIVVGMERTTAERRHESLDAVLEVRPAATAGPPLRWIAAGTSRIVLTGASTDVS